MVTPVLDSEPLPDVDQRIVLNCVTWEQYEALLELFGDDQPGVRMAYLVEMGEQTRAVRMFRDELRGQA